MLEMIHVVPRLPARPPSSHKGDFGRVLIIAGSRGMSGAAVLCGSAALRGGAGLVRLAVPADILPIVAAGNPCYMTAAMPHDDQGRMTMAAEAPLLELSQSNDIVALGPGLGRSGDLDRLVSNLVQKTDRPMVVDADALNALAENTASLKRRQREIIITPHPGEFARLLGTTTSAVQAQRTELATKFATDRGVVVVLKGHKTLVTDGRRVYENDTGNPGMATGGTGDVITGLIAALLGQKLEAFAAAQLGVHLHGLAGDLVRDQLGEVSLVASDLLHYLPRAFRNMS
jgi:NAD(P)H-hydrate epimerase